MAATVTYIGTPPSSPGSSAGSPVTFSGQSIGTAAADRKVVVCWVGIQNSSAAATVTMTIGGVSATLELRVQGGADTSANSTVCAIFSLDVPTGATANIAVTSNQPMFDNTIYVYNVNGAQSGGAAATGQATGNNAPTSYNIDVNTTASSAVVVVSNAYNLSSAGTTWSGATGNAGSGLYGADWRATASFASSSAETPHAIVATTGGYPGGGLQSHVGASAAYSATGAAATSLPVFRRSRRFYTRPFCLLKPEKPRLIIPARMAA